MPGINYRPPIIPESSEVDVIVDGVKKGKMDLDKPAAPAQPEAEVHPSPPTATEEKPKRGRRKKSTSTPDPQVEQLLARIQELEAKLAEQEPHPATTDQVGLPYLTNPPSKPACEVIFDLGKGGKHLKRFHDVIVSEVTLGFVYDTRFEGDQFIPPTTGEEDEPFLVTLVRDNQTFRVLNPFPMGYRLGCLDVIVLLRSSHDESVVDVPPEPNPKYSF